MWPAFEQALTRHHELEGLLGDPGVIADRTRYTKLAKEHGSLAKMVKPYQEYLQVTRDIAQAETMLQEADGDMKALVEEELASLQPRERALHERLEDLLLVEGEDYGSVIVEIRAGTGGDEAALFAGDLYDMYTHYARDMGWRVEDISFSHGEQGGFKEIVFSVTGDEVFQHLRYESGGHRVQRVPKTEQQGRIHTSAATVAVLPEPEEVDIVIRPEDLQVDVMRSGGPGGQHQNKTESGVRITHLPSGLVVNCRDERSQHKNKTKAMRILRSRLFDQVQERARSERDLARRTLIGSGDRSQRIRTYNFPQNRVTDHRIGLTLYNLDRVIQGDLHPLTTALIDHDRREQLGEG
jgi:peptide chain release factor 1